MTANIKDTNSNLLKQSISIVELNNIFDDQQLSSVQRIGEDSLKISGGQKQRIAIARALYRKPDLLIFDESFNSLDTESEKNILRNIKQNFPDITILLISHREDSLKICDQIIELN
jgi:ABC-type bacteriocin/lantibiotic exporter with double-glycine peptidase domain